MGRILEGTLIQSLKFRFKILNAGLATRAKGEADEHIPNAPQTLNPTPPPPEKIKP